MISTPIVIGVIEKSRKGAFEDSAYGVLDAGRLYFVNKLADENTFKGATFTFPEGGELKISGTKPAGGTMSLNVDGEQALVLWDNDKKWCAYKSYNMEKIEISEYKNSKCTTHVSASVVGLAKDISNKGNDGVIYGDSTIDENGITFHGRGFVDAGNANVNFNKGVTFVIRFKLNEKSNQAQCIFGNWEAAGGGIQTKSNTLEVYGNLYNGTYPNGFYLINYAGDATLGQYTTIVYTYDQMKSIIYMNGIRKEEKVLSSSIATSSVNIYIGANPQKSGEWLEPAKITVTDALVLTRSVTDEEVTNYFKDQISAFQDSKILFQYKW